MNGRRKSDRSIVPEKPANKAGGAPPAADVQRHPVLRVKTTPSVTNDSWGIPSVWGVSKRVDVECGVERAETCAASARTKMKVLSECTVSPEPTRCDFTGLSAGTC